MKASGDVADYTSAVTNAMAAKVAASANVDAGSVEVAVAAGSVIITFTIRADTLAAAAAAGDAVSADLADASKATAFFSDVPGITIQVDSVTRPMAGTAEEAGSPPQNRWITGLWRTLFVCVTLFHVVALGMGANALYRRYRRKKAMEAARLRDSAVFNDL